METHSVTYRSHYPEAGEYQWKYQLKFNIFAGIFNIQQFCDARYCIEEFFLGLATFSRKNLQFSISHHFGTHSFNSAEREKIIHRISHSQKNTNNHSTSCIFACKVETLVQPLRVIHSAENFFYTITMRSAFCNRIITKEFHARFYRIFI